MAKIEVRETDDKKFGVYLDSVLIGDSKAQFDADHAAVMLRQAMAAERSDELLNTKTMVKTCFVAMSVELHRYLEMVGMRIADLDLEANGEHVDTGD